MIESPLPPAQEPYRAALTAEASYQIVMIGALLELVLLVALAPRGLGAAPVCYSTVAALRLTALIVLGAVLGMGRDAPKRVGIVALSVWGAILFPPELWAFALEARGGLPVSSLLSVVLGIGVFAALRWHAHFGWAWVAVMALTLLSVQFTLEPLSLAPLIVAALGLIFLRLEPRRGFGTLPRKGNL